MTPLPRRRLGPAPVATVAPRGLVLPPPLPRPLPPPRLPPRWVPPRAPRTADGTSLLIGGRETTDTDLRMRALRGERLLDARGKLTCQLFDPPVAPAMDMDVLFTLGGVPWFGGIVVEVAQQVAEDLETPIWAVTASDNLAILDGIQINNISPAGTLKSVLDWMIAINLGAFGFTVDPAQAAGPPLPAIGFPFQSFAEALKQLGTLTEWSAVISPTRVIRMYPGGAVPAPWAIDEVTDTIARFTARQSRDGHATHVWIRYGRGAPSEVPWTTVGDGSTTAWQPPYQVTTPPNVVLVNGTTLPVFPAPDPGWAWDAAGGWLHAPTGAPPLTAADTIALTLLANWPAYAVAVDGTATLPLGIVIDYPDVFDAALAQSLADGELARRQGYPRRFTLSTARVGLAPGQTVPIDIPRMGLSTTALVTGVRLAQASVHAVDGAPWWSLEVELVEANASRGNWLTFWNQKAGAPGGGGGSGSGSSVTGTIPPGGTYIETTFGGSRTITRTGVGPLPEWMPVILDRSKLSGGHLTIYGEVAIFAGGGTVSLRLMRYDVPSATWIAVATGTPVGGTPAAFAWTEFTAEALDGRIAYRVDLVPSVSTAIVTGVARVTAV